MAQDFGQSLCACVTVKHGLPARQFAIQCDQRRQVIQPCVPNPDHHSGLILFAVPSAKAANRPLAASCVLTTPATTASA